MDGKYSWIDTHKGIVQYLRDKENSQQELIDLLKSLGITGFNDRTNPGKHDIELREIDPFTFFCYIHKHGPKRALGLLQQIAEQLNLEKPTTVNGIPSAQPQRVWLFPPEYLRVNNEVPRLWNLFHKELKGEVDDDVFADALDIKNVGRAKLTEALFYINPEKYLPINGPTIPYIKDEIGLDPAFNTYNEYIDLLSKIREKIEMPFYELSHEAWKWSKERGKVNYWVFQGNPDVFDFEKALHNNVLKDWTVSAHKDKIKPGDRVILWISGKMSGCYALAKITSEPQMKTTSPDDHLWKEDRKAELKANIEITHNLIDNPILKDDIDGVKELANLKVGNQGTNFSATETEYNAILSLVEQGISFDEVRGKFETEYGASLFENFIENLRKIVSELNLKPDDERIVYSVRYNRFNFIIGQRYCFNIRLAHPNGVYGYISTEEGVGKSEPFKGTPKTYFNRVDDFSSIDWDALMDTMKKELDKTTKSSYWKSNNKEFENYVFNGDISASPIDCKMNLCRNTILYGPPGTGKTYMLKNKYMPMFTAKKNAVTREEYLKDIIKDCPWWQVIALVVLDLGKTKVSEIAKHEYIRIKTQLSNTNTVAPTIWGQLQSHTVEECDKVNVQRRMTPLIFNKAARSEWEILEGEVEEQAPELYELKSKLENFEASEDEKIERYEFLTFHQSYAYEDFIEGIKPKLADSEVAYEIEEGVFQKLCNRARNDLKNNYAVFIDEINRGNISSVFGELITLIEEDKREGEANEIKATLPYSKKHFSVPKNVYIIGTMNTADRSVEALDTALRRRFSFMEMNPVPSLLSNESFRCEGVDLTAMLEAINGRIEKLMDKDYCIGHSYFMTIKNKQEPLEELKYIFQNKILPLLQEYFYGDWGKIRLIVGKEFVEMKKKSDVEFLDKDSMEDYEEFDEKPIYSFTNCEEWTLKSFRSVYEKEE